ncbi:8013_t:CDS:1, partial [Ambispora gerdemannii]
IKEETIIRVEQVFDELLESKLRLNDLYQCAHSVSEQISDDIYDEINNHSQQIEKKTVNFIYELKECLIKVRSDTAEIDILDSSIQQLENSILSKDSVMGFINKHQSIFIKTELISVLKTNK